MFSRVSNPLQHLVAGWSSADVVDVGGAPRDILQPFNCTLANTRTTTFRHTTRMPLITEFHDSLPCNIPSFSISESQANQQTQTSTAHPPTQNELPPMLSYPPPSPQKPLRQPTHSSPPLPPPTSHPSSNLSSHASPPRNPYTQSTSPDTKPTPSKPPPPPSSEPPTSTPPTSRSVCKLWSWRINSGRTRGWLGTISWNLY